ncbi:MAG: aldo/keto reductase [Candidatus Fermentithermobacillus carboniphilus]|uniref:Aldo/keto reductase n=1 Tax=Candidatus Fermentithermobacillus carboniphilus TaxID=3085328 RepID=A0AAT9LF24_9FIRM|nr:MAG: aldo/keto reductase [Candidatus Fermentithermobacillus carboniphilus]
MERRELGKTGLVVTELCFGVLPMGPNQFSLEPEKGGELIREGILNGINFLDTAQSYRTYPHIKFALDGLKDAGSEVVIATKSAAKTYEEMEQAVEEARKALDRDVIDIFHLHAARVDAGVFKERAGALECLVDMKAKGIVRAVGISTHSVEVVRKAAEIPEIDVVFPIINIEGLGILHGTRDDMARAIVDAAESGKGLYAMKALGGGNLLSDREKAINYVRNLRGITSVAVGMVSYDELEMNLLIFNGQKVPEDLARRTVRTKRLVIQAFCRGCGTCVKICPNGAMTVVDGKAHNDREKCILCGYCAPVCPEFAIRLV